MAAEGNGADDVEMGGMEEGGAAAAGAAAAGDSDSDDDLEVDPQVEQLIMQLEAQLGAQPRDYEAHVKLISALKAARLAVRLRAARERMQALFPLDEALWLDWINDSMAAMASPEDAGYIRQLFEAATQDYLSVTLLEAQLQFLAAADPEVSSKSPAGIAAFRAAAEAALTAAGLHLTEAAHLWSEYRAYEQAVLEEGKGGDKQADAVRSLFQRQLQTPNSALEQVLQEYEAWEAQHGKAEVPPHIKAAVARNKDAADLRAPHEEAVGGGKPADAALLAAYTAYLALEKAQKQPARVQLLFERAVAAFPLTSQLWASYARYLEAEVKVPDVINKVYARAVRNCYWVGSLWEGALRALERSGAPDEQLAELAERALGAGLAGPEDALAVILARADSLRHRLPPQQPAGSAAAAALRAWFQQGSQLIAARYPDAVDTTLRLPGYWARVEGVVLGDLAAMRGVWEEATKGQLGRLSGTWTAWADMERALREPGGVRAVLKRALGRQQYDDAGGRLALAQYWLRFEREEGSADDLMAATLKVEPILEEANASAAAAAAAAGGSSGDGAAAKLSREQVKAMRQAHDPNYKERKPGTKRDADGEEITTKRSRAGEQQQQHHQGDADMGSPPSFSAPARPGERRWHTDEHTVFVKNLGFAVGEEDLRQLFEGLGVRAVRLGLDRNTGKSRGFAYVEFDSDDGVSAAVGKDGSEVKGRSLCIAKSAPPGSGGGGRGGGGGGRFGDGGGRFSGRGGGRGGRHDGGRGGGGRGRGGLGFQPSTGPSAALMGHQKRHLDIGDAGGGGGEQQGGERKPGAPLVPRALVPRHAAGADDSKPKTNDDFKKMLARPAAPPAE